MCQVCSAAADLQHSEGGYLPPHTVVSAQRRVRFLVLVLGYVCRWDWSGPPLRKLNAWDAGEVLAHVTCENRARDTFSVAQKVNSVKGPEGAFDTNQYSLPPDPYQGHARGQGLATRDP